MIGCTDNKQDWLYRQQTGKAKNSKQKKNRLYRQQKVWAVQTAYKIGCTIVQTTKSMGCTDSKQDRLYTCTDSKQDKLYEQKQVRLYRPQTNILCIDS